jgi:uncharacterized protein YecT (DUF1311 family)
MPAQFQIVLFVALLNSTLFAVTPGFAAIGGQPDPAAAQTIDACVGDAMAAKSDPDACIGRVSDPCLKSASTTTAMEQCNNREFLVWQADLNRDYAQLMTRLTDDHAKQMLREVQRAFFVYKLQRCTFERTAHKNAPPALVAAARCQARATARYDLWLIEQINVFPSP